MNSKSGIPLNKITIGIALIFLISAVSDIIWLSYEDQPPSWDEALHLTKSLQYYNANSISDLINIDNYYPPFYHFSTVLTYWLFGTSMDSAISINILYFLILLISTYGIAKSLHSKEVGLIAVLLVALYPSMIGLRRFYLIEIALVSTTALSLYTLLLTNYFKNTKYSALFGLTLAIAILTKWTAIFFIIGPLLYILYKSKPLNKQNLSIFIIIALAISLIWYAPHFTDVYKQITWGNEFWGKSEGDPEVLTIASLTHYTFALINFQLSPLFFILFIAGLSYMFRSKNPNIFLLSWIIIPYIVMTLLRNKNDRYTLPSIVAVAIISAMWLSSVSKRTLIFYVTLFAIFQVSIASPVTVSGIDIIPQTTYGLRAPISTDWHVEDALSKISADQNRPAIVGVLPDFAQVNGLTYQYYAYKNRMPVEVIPVPYFESFEPFAKNFLNFDYLILKTGENSGESRKQLVKNFHDLFYQYGPEYYIPLANYTLPDNTTLQVYKNNIKVKQ